TMSLNNNNFEIILIKNKKIPAETYFSKDNMFNNYEDYLGILVNDSNTSRIYESIKVTINKNDFNMSYGERMQNLGHIDGNYLWDVIHGPVSGTIDNEYFLHNINHLFGCFKSIFKIIFESNPELTKYMDFKKLINEETKSTYETYKKEMIERRRQYLYGINRVLIECDNKCP